MYNAYIPRYNNEAVKLVPALREVATLSKYTQSDLPKVFILIIFFLFIKGKCKILLYHFYQHFSCKISKN